MSTLQSAAWAIPSSLQQEHAELHAELEAATRAPGVVGAAARRVATTLHPHFVREEQIALPPLALLQPLTQGPVTMEMREILPLTDALRQELPAMLREHQAIGEALDELAHVAREEEEPAYAALSDKIRAHALNEEQVLYPAAILVGEFVRRGLPE
jgi:iron-sulfur cluster repair protein YtfE (RIC family)